MKPSDIKQLQQGDKLFWEDPEEFRSKIITIKKIRSTSYKNLVIQTMEGDTIYCDTDQIKPCTADQIKRN